MAYWRSQRIIVHSLAQPNVLSTPNISTGLTTHPARALPSPFIPRLSSLVFHPTEMLYGVGEPDGTSKSLSPILGIITDFLSSDSQNHGLQASLTSFCNNISNHLLSLDVS